MRVSYPVVRALTATSALAMLIGSAGCGSMSTALAPRQTADSAAHAQQLSAVQSGAFSNGVPSLVRPRNPVKTPNYMDPDAVTKPLVFVSDAGLEQEVVDIFRQSDNKMVGQITGITPEGLTTDAARNLYIANTDYLNVLIYAPPYTTVTLTLDDGGNIPRDVAVSTTGLVAVANVCSLADCSGNTGSVSFFAKGSTKPCKTVADATDFASMENATFDSSGDLYVEGNGAAGHAWNIGKIVGGCNASSIQLLKTPNPRQWIGGIEIDSDQRIAVVNVVTVDQPFYIDTYNPPKHSSLGRPVSMTRLFRTTSNAILNFAFLKSGLAFYDADSENGNPGSKVDEYNYPTSGPPITTIGGFEMAWGVAVTPVLLP